MKHFILLIAAALLSFSALAQQDATQAAQAEALKKHPELGKAGSAFNVEFVARFKRYKTEKPEFFTDGAWPLKLANEVAAARAGATTATPTQSKPDATPNSKPHGAARLEGVLRNPSERLCLAANGSLVGVAQGEKRNEQIIYSVTPAGALSVLARVMIDENENGGFSELLDDGTGNFYGVDRFVGDDRSVPGGDIGGKVVKFTRSGTVTTIAKIKGDGNGRWDQGCLAWSGLTRDKTGNLYGTTREGGPNKGSGTI